MEGSQLSSQIYSLYQKILTNREIIRIIKEKCDGIKFTGKTEPVDMEYTIGTVKGLETNDDRKVPYIIRNLPQYPADQQGKGGACAQVLLPAGEKVTIALS